MAGPHGEPDRNRDDRLSVFTIVDGAVVAPFDGHWLPIGGSRARGREAAGASRRCAASSLRCDPPGDPLPSTRRSAAMAASGAFGHWPIVQCSVALAAGARSASMDGGSRWWFGPARAAFRPRRGTGRSAARRFPAPARPRRAPSTGPRPTGWWRPFSPPSATASPRAKGCPHHLHKGLQEPAQGAGLHGR